VTFSFSESQTQKETIMADTIISVKDARFSLSTKEIYFQIKADQKAIMTESRTHSISSAYDDAWTLWHNSRPGTDAQAYLAKKPLRPWILGCSPRSMNIVYSMLRGHKYRDVEKIYREHNGPNKQSIAAVLSHYGIDESAFYQACGEIDYE
jgi:hypothetical protein